MMRARPAPGESHRVLCVSGFPVQHCYAASGSMVALVHQPFPMPGRRRAQSWRYQPAFRRPRHFHEEAELNLVVKGRGVFTLGPREVSVQAGALLWFPPGLDHYLLSASEDFDLFVVGFHVELLEALRREDRARVSFVRPPERLVDATWRRCGEVLALAQTSGDDTERPASSWPGPRPGVMSWPACSAGTVATSVAASVAIKACRSAITATGFVSWSFYACSRPGPAT
jgi:quercetin dioxygenase-like cupin family protein